MVEAPKNEIENTNINGVLDMFKNMITKSKLNGLESSIIGNEKKAEIEKKAVEGMGKIGDIFKIQIPFLGDLGTLFGKKRPIDLLGTKEERSKNKILNGILKALHFGDMEEIHTKYIESQLNGVDKEFAESCFKEYEKEESKTIDAEKSSRKICELDAMLSSITEEEKTNIKSKIPENFIGLKEAIVKELPKHINKLSLSTVNMVDSSLIITENNETKVDIKKIEENPEDFIDKYLKLSIPLFANSGEAFIASQNVNTNTFAYALFGNLTGEKFFVEGVKLGLIGASLGGNTIENEKIKIEADPDQIQKIKNELAKFKNTPITAEMIINSSAQYKIPSTYILAIIENDSSCGTAGKGAKTHNPGNVGNDDAGNTKDRGTREAGIDAVAKNIARRISEYQKIYGNTMPTIKQLAQNQGPDGNGFLSNQGNFQKPNPNFIGAYMTSKEGQERVQEIAENLAQDGISNERMAA